jgi:hypothetical protein
MPEEQVDDVDAQESGRSPMARSGDPPGAGGRCWEDDGGEALEPGHVATRRFPVRGRSCQHQRDSEGDHYTIAILGCGGHITQSRGTFVENHGKIVMTDSGRDYHTAYRISGTAPHRVLNPVVSPPGRDERLDTLREYDYQPRRRLSLRHDGTPLSIWGVRLGMIRKEVCARRGRPVEVLASQPGGARLVTFHHPNGALEPEVGFSADDRVLLVSGSQFEQGDHVVVPQSSSLEDCFSVFGKQPLHSSTRLRRCFEAIGFSVHVCAYVNTTADDGSPLPFYPADAPVRCITLGNPEPFGNSSHILGH